MLKQLYSLDMNLNGQQRSFCNFNINVVIIWYASTKVKNTFYYNKLLILDMNLYVWQRSYMHDPGSRNCAIFVHYINSFELHLQSVALRSQYSDPMPEVVTLQ